MQRVKIFLKKSLKLPINYNGHIFCIPPCTETFCIKIKSIYSNLEHITKLYVQYIKCMYLKGCGFMHVHVCTREDVHVQVVVCCGHICRSSWKSTQLLGKSKIAVSLPALEQIAVSLVKHYRFGIRSHVVRTLHMTNRITLNTVRCSYLHTEIR